MGNTASEDFITLLTTTFDHSNTTNLTADPSFFVKSEMAFTSFPTNGFITVERERLSRNDIRGNYVLRVYTLDVLIVYHPATAASTDIKEIITEVERVCNANNESVTRTYGFEILYDWDTSEIDSQASCQISASKFWELKNT